MTGDTHNSVSGDARIDGLVQAGHIDTVILGRGSAEPRLPTPHQLPPGPRRFVDRDMARAQVMHAVNAVFAAAPGTPSRGRPFDVTVSGTWGVGRTAFVHDLAHRLADELGMRVLSLDLDSIRRDGAIDLAQALGLLLTDLGVTPHWLGSTVYELSRQYWDRSSRHRLVLVLDNARSGAEVSTLLPASGESVSLVVSHDRLHDLDDPPALEIRLEPLSLADSVDLLTSLLGDDARLRAEPGEVDALVELCAGLPAVLRVAARQVKRDRWSTLADIVDRFRGTLESSGVDGMEAVLDAGYEAVDGTARRLYRLVPCAPAAELAPEALAVLLGEDRETACGALEQLLEAGLLEPRKAGRVVMQPLIRAHALRRGSGVDDGSWAARRRFVRWYRRQAQRADLVAAGPRLALAPLLDAAPGAPDVGFGSRRDAFVWLAVERTALHGCVRIAYEDGARAATDEAADVYADGWALCEPLWTDHLDHPEVADTPDVFGLGLLCAQRAEHLPAAVRMRCLLGRVHWERREFPQAERVLEAAVSAAALLADGGSPAGETTRKLYASALEFRGRAQAVQGNWAAAVPDYEASLAVHQGIPHAYGELLLTYLLGRAAAAQGEPEHAEDLLTRAHDAAVAQERVRMTARIRVALAAVRAERGRLPEAQELYEKALTAARERESTFDQARILDALADLAERSGDPETARERRAAALAVRTEAGGVPEF